MLEGKVAIVTGAGRGIGRGIALALGKERCSVVVSDVDEKSCEEVVAEIKKFGGNSVAIKCDVSQKTEVDDLIKKTIEKFGKLDILANNAGIYPYKPFMDLTEADWDKVIDVNLKSTFLCSQAAAKVMKDNARIIDISSVASLIGFAGLTHYCASKGGINGFIRALALELAPRKITVNAVAPGAINTPGAASNEVQEKQTVAMIPMARMGEPEDIANAVVFLASDKSSYITGQVLVVDGGWTLR